MGCLLTSYPSPATLRPELQIHRNSFNHPNPLMENLKMTEQATPETTVAVPEITANYDQFHTAKEMKFGFRTLKDEETGVESKRASVEVKVPVLSVQGIVRVLQTGGKELDYLMSVVEGSYSDYIKYLLGNDTSITSENFPYDKVTWEAMANQPESERKGRGIAKEIWEDFIKDYISVMPGLTGKAVKHIEKQAAVLAQKLNPLKNHEDKETLLPKFQDMLAVYAQGSPNAENFEACVKFLTEKADTFLKAEAESNLSANLGFE